MEELKNLEITTENITMLIKTCKTCEELHLKEVLCNNDRLPISMFHKAGREFTNHLQTHFDMRPRI